ncbi:DELLA protein RGL3-like [Durio zibethinus]|uniref:DELLA protein RGL3-like n=1 Tax=Durio zibethinus TaxID=66656 RepID=A0A6P5Z7S1_DURZI|nr:DELLA protein RGL3-like [Durio zibethinus]
MASIRELSAASLLKIARASFSKISSLECFDLYVLNKFFDGGCFNLSGDEIKDVELAILLPASADKVGNRQFDHARKFLNLCDFLSSNAGNSIQRVVYYFSKALRERIDGETGATSSKARESREGELSHPDETIVSLNRALIACFLKLPFIQVTQFSGLQAIIENVASAKKVHFVDLAIRSGAQCTALMQALATRDECPIELLKITAVGTTSQTKMQATDLKDISEDIFELNDGEAVVIGSRTLLRHTLTQPDCLESIIRMLKNLNPWIVVVKEFEVNHTSPIFVERFSEALSFYTAFFYCHEDCMDRCDQNRRILEAAYLGQEIQNIVAAKDEDRIFRDMKIEAWRTNLVAKQFAPGNSCACYRNGQSLVVNLKETPILSLCDKGETYYCARVQFGMTKEVRKSSLQ